MFAPCLPIIEVVAFVAPAAKPGVPVSAYVSDVAEIGRLVEGNKVTPLVLYCNGPYCGKSKRLAEELLAARNLPGSAGCPETITGVSTG